MLKNKAGIQILACVLLASIWWLLHQLPMHSGDPKSSDIAESGEPLNEESKELVRVYGDMEAAFQQHGFDSNKIYPMLSMYNGLGTSDAPWPVKYTEEPKLPKNAVRLLVIPLEGFPSLGDAIKDLSLSVIEALPPTTKVFVNPTELLHITVFHTSRPNDPRPYPIDALGGCDTNQPPHLRKAPLDEDIQEECNIIEPIVARITSPCLTIHRAIMAESGTLLITWIDPCGGVSELRRSLAGSFPGKPMGQAKIIHTSVLRVLSPDAIDSTTINRISKICEDWTALWQNRVFNPRDTWFVFEETFSIINGPRVSMPFSKNAS